MRKSLGQVITSPAFRAIETAMIFAKEFGLSPDTMKISSDLYFDLEPSAYIPVPQLAERSYGYHHSLRS